MQHKKSQFCVLFSAFCRFRRADLVCAITTIHPLLNQTFRWSNTALLTTDAIPDKYQWCYYRISSSRPIVLKYKTITTIPRQLLNNTRFTITTGSMSNQKMKFYKNINLSTIRASYTQPNTIRKKLRALAFFICCRCTCTIFQ